MARTPSAHLLSVLLAGCLLAASPSAVGTTVIVPDQAPNIQYAINICADGDEIIVKPGIYYEFIRLWGKKLYLHSSDGPGNTIISASLYVGVSVVHCIDGETAETIIEGFTITDGTGSPYLELWCGGGMFNVSSSPSVVNCCFTGNTAAHFGGGMANWHSSPSVTGCVFLGNSSLWGGGMGNYDCSYPNITGCVFESNDASGIGGGIYTNYWSTPDITACSFNYNTATESGGGLAFLANSQAWAQGCTFIGNGTNGDGGAVYCETESYPGFFDSSFLENTALRGGAMCHIGAKSNVQRCTFSGNATYGGFGGAIFNDAGDPTAVWCTFSDNWGGFGGGAIRNENGSVPELYNCVIRDNQCAYWGGGVSNADSNPALINCTLNNNVSAYGGGVYNSSSNPVLTNCVVRGDASPEIYDEPGSSPVVTYCNIAGGYAGEGNIDADPKFVDQAAGDLHLSGGSPCIDAGNSLAVPDWCETDLDGNPRFHDDTGIIDTGLGFPCVDMGAYEFQGESPLPCPADFDGDGDVDTADLLHLLGAWGTPDGDVDGDNDTDTADLLALLAAWGECP